MAIADVVVIMFMVVDVDMAITTTTITLTKQHPMLLDSILQQNGINFLLKSVTRFKRA